MFEILGNVAYLRELRVLNNKNRKEKDKLTFFEQEQVLAELVNKYKPYRIYVDQTGMGEKVVEDYKRKFGNTRVQGVLFNLANKQEMAINAKQVFEDKRVRLPYNNDYIRSDLRKIKRIVTSSSNLPKFDTEKDKNGHGDIAWAIFLALLAFAKPYVPYSYTPVLAKEKLRLKKIKGAW